MDENRLLTYLDKVSSLFCLQSGSCSIDIEPSSLIFSFALYCVFFRCAPFSSNSILLRRSRSFCTSSNCSLEMIPSWCMDSIQRRRGKSFGASLIVGAVATEFPQYFSVSSMKWMERQCRFVKLKMSFLSSYRSIGKKFSLFWRSMQDLQMWFIPASFAASIIRF